MIAWEGIACIAPNACISAGLPLARPVFCSCMTRCMYIEFDKRNNHMTHVARFFFFSCFCARAPSPSRKQPGSAMFSLKLTPPPLHVFRNRRTRLFSATNCFWWFCWFQITAEYIFASLATLSEFVVFLYMGMGVFTGRFRAWDWRFIGLTIVFCLVSRLFNTFPFSALANLWWENNVIFVLCVFC